MTLIRRAHRSPHTPHLCPTPSRPQVKEALRSLLALHRAGHQRFGFTPQGALEALDDAHAAQEPEAPLLAAPGLAAAV